MVDRKTYVTGLKTGFVAVAVLFYCFLELKSPDGLSFAGAEAWLVSRAWYVVAVLLGGFSFFQLVVDYEQHLRLVRIIRDKPSGPIGDVEPGVQLITGQLLAADEELVSPLGRIPCISYVVVAYYVLDVEPEKRETVFRDEKSCDAILRDDTGLLRIATQEIETVQTSTSSHRIAPFTNDPSLIEQALTEQVIKGQITKEQAQEHAQEQAQQIRNNRILTKRIRKCYGKRYTKRLEKKHGRSLDELIFSETVLPARRKYTALGRVISREGQLTLTDGSSGSLLSQNPEHEILSELTSRKIFMPLGLVLWSLLTLSPAYLFIPLNAGASLIWTILVAVVLAWAAFWIPAFLLLRVIEDHQD